MKKGSDSESRVQGIIIALIVGFLITFENQQIVTTISSIVGLIPAILKKPSPTTKGSNADSDPGTGTGTGGTGTGGSGAGGSGTGGSGAGGSGKFVEVAEGWTIVCITIGLMIGMLLGDWIS